MLHPPSVDDARRLRSFFSDANYSLEGLRETLVANELTARRLRNLPRLLDRTREPSALHTLMRWFSVGVPVAQDAARESIPDWALQILTESGLLVPNEDALAPTVMLTPFEGLLIATDLSLKVEAATDPDVVLVINPTTWLLYRFTIRRPSRVTLDLGAGCGALALASLEYSEQAVATDLNPRATEFAAFNARFNGCEAVECLCGDAFQPVAGRTFDRIVANPPFFISPASGTLFCDNTMDLDLFCRKLVREAPRYLNEGGYLQMVCEWAEIEGQPWQERVSEWFEGSGCDAWVMKGHSEEPSKYAQDRIRETTPDSPQEDAKNYAEWMAYYRHRRVEKIHNGLIAMRRRSGNNWIRIDDIPASPKQPFGETILDGFAARDFLEAHQGDEGLLDAKPKVSPHARLDQRMHHSDGRWRLNTLDLRLVNGFPFSQKLEPLVAEFVGYLDGTRSLREAIEQLSGQVDAPAERVRQECLQVVRTLIERGFVLP